MSRGKPHYRINERVLLCMVGIGFRFVLLLFSPFVQ